MPLIALDVAAVAVAAALALLYWAASTIFGPMLRAMADAIPVIGMVLTASVAIITDRIRSSAESWIDWGISPAIGVIGTPADKHDHMLTQIESVFDTVRGRLRSIPEAIMQYIGTYVHNVIGDAIQSKIQSISHIIDVVTAKIDAIPTTVTAAINTAMGNIVSKLNNTIATAISAIDTRVSHISSHVDSVYHDLSTTISTDVNSVRNDTQNAIHTAISAIDTTIGDIRNDITGALDTAERYADNIGHTLSNNIAKVLGTATAAGAVAVTVADELSKLEKNCTNDLCTSFGWQSRELQKLSTLIEEGTFIAWILSALNDPDGWADETIDTVTPIIRNIVDRM